MQERAKKGKLKFDKKKKDSADVAPNGEKKEAVDASSLLKEQQQQQQPPMTKRQRRKQRNDKHAWPQHPKIQSSEARSKAYLRAAGLAAAAATTTPKNQDDPVVVKASAALSDESAPSVQFGRLLGGPDARVRHRAMLELRAYLKARCALVSETTTQKDDQDDQEQRLPPGLSEFDLLKLWKCLWHTLYMADRVPVQQAVAEHMANLMECFQGTPEQDEVASQAYLDLCLQQQQQEEEQEKDLLADDEGDDDEQEMDEQEHDNDDDDDEEEDMQDYDEDYEQDEDDVVMEEIANTLEDEDEEDDEQDEEGYDDEDYEQNEDDPQSIRHCQGSHLAALWLRTGLRTCVREWDRMDKYRIDKFYTLLRFMMKATYKYLAQRHWNLGMIRLFNDAMFDEVLSQLPNGPRYHLIDAVLPELAAASQHAPMPLTEATLIDCLEPYLAMAQTGGLPFPDDTVQQRVVDKILIPLLEEYSVLSDAGRAAAKERADDADSKQQGEPEDGDEKESGSNTNGKKENKKKQDDASSPPILEQVHVGTIARFVFDLASDGNAIDNDEYRKSLYNVHKQYLRKVKQYGFEYDVQLGDEYEPQPEQQQQHDDDDDDQEDEALEEMDEEEDDDDDENDDVEADAEDRQKASMKAKRKTGDKDKTGVGSKAGAKPKRDDRKSGVSTKIDDDDDDFDDWNVSVDDMKDDNIMGKLQSATKASKAATASKQTKHNDKKLKDKSTGGSSRSEEPQKSTEGQVDQSGKQKSKKKGNAASDSTASAASKSPEADLEKLDDSEVRLGEEKQELSKPKKSKSKKKKAQKDQLDSDSEPAAGEREDETPPSSKANRQKTGAKDDTDGVKDAEGGNEEESDQTPPKKRKRNKKKAKKESSPTNTDGETVKKADKSAGEKPASPTKKSSQEEGRTASVDKSSSSNSKSKKAQKEDEVIISLKDQKAAKTAMTESSEKKNKKRKQDDKSSPVDSANKRVKFLPRNQARSWKESMKGLRTMDSPIRKSLTPERGILLNKDKVSLSTSAIQKKTSKRNKQRRKSTDYF